MQKKDFDIVATIATRKAEFYENVKNNLLASLPGDVNRTEADKRLRQAIADLDNMLFVSEEEKATEVIKAGLAVRDLKLNKDKILGPLLQAMTKDG